MDQIPLDDLIDTPGVMIDIYDKVHRMVDGKLSVIENYVLTKKDVVEWEGKNGQIKRGSIVFMRSGWGQRWPDEKAFRGVHTNTNATKKVEGGEGDGGIKLDNLGLNFPGFDSSAAKYLTVERGVIGVGIDTLSIDAGSSKIFPAHQIFAARNVWMLEMVANMHLLPPRGFNLWVIPFKIDRGTGAPTRVLARINK